MRRRNLLKGIAASPWVAAMPAAFQIKVPGALPKLQRVRPTDPVWPDAASWEKLRGAVNGELIQVHSLFGACSSDAGGAACLEAEKNIGNPFYIGDQPAGTQVSGWLDAWTPAPSTYAVKAASTADIVAAVNFARDNNLRIVVKGAGHSYQGTSNAPDSLLVWTRAMNKVMLHESFVPRGGDGKIAGVPAVTAEAGALWIDLYDAVTTRGGRYVQGGGCADVGVAGLVQSGGFGSFSKGFGLAAAGLLEAEVVTADGQARTVNAFNEPDLFWALKGGGGGTFGVVTKLTLRTHDLPAFFGYAAGKVQAQSDAAFARLIARFITFYRETLFNPHWGEQVHFGPGNMFEISMLSQGLSNDEVNAAWRPFADWMRSSPADYTMVSPPFCGAGGSRDWWKAPGNHSMNLDTRDGAPAHHGWWKGDQSQVGVFIHGFESLWLPESLLRDDLQHRLADALFAASRSKQVQLHFNKGLAGASPEVRAAARQTATNPAVADAFALVIIADGEAPAYPGLARPAMDLAAAHTDARNIDQATAELRKIVPDAGSYVSESNYFNPAWQQAFWGGNYSRLRRIKTAYDPGGLFFVHHGVGSEDWSADGFTRRV